MMISDIKYLDILVRHSLCKI